MYIPELLYAVWTRPHMYLLQKYTLNVVAQYTQNV